VVLNAKHAHLITSVQNETHGFCLITYIYVGACFLLYLQCDITLKVLPDMALWMGFTVDITEIFVQESTPTASFGRHSNVVQRGE
jgi:uncharacterized membrane protein